MKKRYIIMGGIIVLAVAALVSAGLRGSVSYYLTVSELLDRGDELLNTKVRVIGRIVGDSIEWKADELELSFVISEGDRYLPVIYHGPRPSGFSAGSSILVEGQYRPDKVFHATTLIMRCPSKYEPEG